MVTVYIKEIGMQHNEAGSFNNKYDAVKFIAVVTEEEPVNIWKRFETGSSTEYGAKKFYTELGFSVEITDERL